MKMSKVELIGTFLNTSILSSFDNSYHDKCCELMGELLSRLKRGEKYKLFFESCSCLFAEGVEFMTKTEIYEAIKKEVKKLEGEP